jgi:hypothetical protein
MTKYGWGGDQYVPETSFEDWLRKHEYPESYGGIFSWNEEKIKLEYDRLFDGYEKVSQQLEALVNLFEETHQSRIAYMQEHGIDQWSDLDSVHDKEHIESKDAFFEKISSVRTQQSELKKERASSFGALPLVAGIFNGSYTGFDKICDDERRTHAMMSTNNSDPMWRSIGPLRNPFWRMYPRIE